MCLEKRKTALKTFVTSQFGYWMFHNRDPNIK